MRTMAVGLLVCLAGCDGGNDYGALFGAPQSTTTSLYGTWGGELDFFEIRWVLAPDRVTLANRCGDRIVGVDASAAVTDSEIRVLEAASAGDSDCSVRTNVGATPACSADPLLPKVNCFVHDQRSLFLFGVSDALELIKQSDETTP
jgi:hypothetical protein